MVPTVTVAPMRGSSPSHAERTSRRGRAGGEVTLPRRRTELLVSLMKLELDKAVLREMRTGMRVIGGR